MDKRFTGKWTDEVRGDILNIFDETPYRMKMSCPSSGHYNFEPNCVYEKDGDFCFELNDEKYRMIYYLKYRDGFLVGRYTQFGKETAVRFARSSETPEDEPYRHVQEVVVPEASETRIELLKKYAGYDREKQTEAFETEYVLGGKVPEVLEEYDYSRYIGEIGSSDDRIAFRLLDFVCDHFRHDGSIGLRGECRIEDIVRFCRKHKDSINCRGLAMLLASLLRANGIKARHITCMPYEEPFRDCHVVVDCLLPSGKRIMLDPSYHLYLKDGDGGYVSLERLREMLLEDEPFFANEDASHNHEGFDSEDYRNYMTKNTFRFSRGTYCANGVDDSEGNRLELIPAGYPAEKFGKQARAEFVYNDIEFWKM